MKKLHSDSFDLYKRNLTELHLKYKYRLFLLIVTWGTNCLGADGTLALLTQYFKKKIFITNSRYGPGLQTD